jgi:hypothetical protein
LARSFYFGLVLLLGAGLALGAASVTPADLGPYELHQTIPNPSPADGDIFGQAVAWVGADLLVGAPGHAHANGATSAGAAYLFDGATYTQTAIFELSAPVTGTQLGFAVSLIGADVLLGAPGEIVSATSKAGAAYRFDLTGSLIETFVNPSPAIFDSFGLAVAGMGSDALVGAPQVNDGALVDSGEAYLLSGAGGTVTQPITITNPSPGFFEQFGAVVAVFGEDLLISAPLDTVSGTVQAGAVYQFTTGGSLVTTYYKPTQTFDDQFGGSLTVLDNKIIVGSPRHDVVSGTEVVTNTGAVYVFDGLSGQLLYELTSPSPQPEDHFGFAVAAAGEHILVGAPDADVVSGAVIADAGAAYLFSAADGAYLQTFANPTPDAGDKFGLAVAALADFFLIGAPLDDAGAANAGVVHVFGPLLPTPTSMPTPTGQPIHLPVIIKSEPPP